MAVYKVPQDVEAEDKLLGPFSFKQFIFLIIMVASLALAYGLSRILLPLAIIPLPVAIFFGTLALPLRKDQPMEVYLAAVISFIMKPKTRLWRPDGVESLIEVVAPINNDKQYGKGYSQEEVQKRLSYLANLVDSRGWSVRGLDEPDSSMRHDLYNEAQATDDLLDDQGSRAQQIDGLLAQYDERKRQEILQKMSAPANIQQVAQATVGQAAPQPVQPPMVSPVYTPMSVVQPENPDEDIRLTVNPYPTMSQSVITPLGEQPAPVAQPAQEPQPTPQPPSVPEPVSPAIIDLANNHADLSIETLQREASRIKQKETESEEVVISLR